MLSLHGDELAIPFDFIAPSLDVMLENLNNSLFYFINATPDSAQWIISLAIFIAKDVINIVPLLAVVLWLWGPRDRVCAQRQPLSPFSCRRHADWCSTTGGCGLADEYY